MKQIHLTVNGYALTFSEDLVPEVKRVLQEALNKPGDQAVSVSEFGEIRAFMDGPEIMSQTIGGTPNGAKAMVNQNVKLTDC